MEPVFSSSWVNFSAAEPPAPVSGHLIDMLFCSRVPMSSSFLLPSCLTGRTMRADCVNRKRPGNTPLWANGMCTTSVCCGTMSSCSSSSAPCSAEGALPAGCNEPVSSSKHALISRSLVTAPAARHEGMVPTTLPSRKTVRWEGGPGGTVAGAEGTIPSPDSTCSSAASVACGCSGPWVTTLHAAVKWFSRPQGAPSGVCTGHMKPHDSGRSLRTAVVRSCAKYAPRCTERKWLM
mmetsp:Transcript_14172/g.38391  ORF Transcript_14172/g.38391 Transcript_14172/m.38391 type:complete len:235 (-) Transcript_14172:1625-2329(-)